MPASSPENSLSPWAKPKWIFLLKILTILLFGAWIYWPVLHGGWMMDDDVYLTGNPLLNDPARLWKAWFEPGSFVEYYPIQQSLQWLQWQLWHDNTFGYHVTNLVLHLVSALLIWRLLAKFSLRLAWLGGLLFAIHPAMVESVVWIAEFKNTLSLPPFLLAMIFYLDYEQQGSRRDYWLALGFFIVAMLCKISMAAFPFVILLYGWWKRGRIGWNDLKASVPFFFISLGLGLLSLCAGNWYGAANHTGPGVVPLGGFFSRVALAGLSISFYFWNCVWPVGLLPIYPHWPVNPPSLIQFLPWPILIAILYGLWTQRHDCGRHALLGLGFFLIMLGPFVTINVGGYTTFTWVMDHFLYIPIIGVIGLAVAGVEEVSAWMSRSQNLIGRAILTVILGLLIWDCRAYASLFINQQTLWTYELQHNPDAWLAHNNLGNALLDQGRVPQAIQHFEEVTNLNPDYAPAYNNWGNALMQIGQLQDALALFNRALSIDPDSAEAHSDRGLALARLGHLPEAITEYQQAVQLKPTYPDAQNNWGAALALSGHPAEAIEHYQETLRIKPDFAQVHNNWGNALMQTGQFSEAISHYQKALELKPDYAEAHYDWGLALARQNQLADAIDQFQEAIRLKPDYASAYNNSAVLLSQLGRKTEALEQLREALRLDPDNLDVKNNLASLLGQKPSPTAK